MAQANLDISKHLIDVENKRVNWNTVFHGVKNIVRSNNLNDETRACLKGWLKASDSTLHQPLLSLTVLHTITLNASVIVRNQIAGPKVFKRLEKQLSKPQGPPVSAAILQLFVDWAYLFANEDLGRNSRAILSQARYSAMAAAQRPSLAITSLEEDMRLGIPPVAPIRGEDFIRWMHRAAGTLDVSSSGGAPAAPTPMAAPGSMGRIPPPVIVVQAVPSLCGSMQTDVQRLVVALKTCRAAACTGSMTELTAAMDQGYREAERCSQWRRRVHEFTQQCEDPVALSSVLAATDVINTGLRDWQAFASSEVYTLMRISVQPMPAGARLARPQSGSGNMPAAIGSSRGIAGPGSRGVAAPPAARTFDVDDLLGGGMAPSAAPAAAMPQCAAAPVAAAVAAFDPFGASSSTAAPLVRNASAGVAASSSGSTATWTPAGPLARASTFAHPAANPFAPANTPVWTPPPQSAPATSGNPFVQAPAASAPAPAAGQVPAYGSPANAPANGSAAAAHSKPITNPFAGIEMQAAAPGRARPAAPAPSGSTSSSPAQQPAQPAGWASFGDDAFVPAASTSYSPAAAAVAATTPSSLAASPQPVATSPALPQPVPPLGQPPGAPPRAYGAANGSPATNGPSTLHPPHQAAHSPPTPLASLPAGWQAELSRVTSDIRHILQQPQHPGAPGMAQSPPRPSGPSPHQVEAVVGRVDALCRALALQHAQQVAALQQQHAHLVAEVKGQALAKIREVIVASQGAPAAAGVSAVWQPHAAHAQGAAPAGVVDLL